MSVENFNRLPEYNLTCRKRSVRQDMEFMAARTQQSCCQNKNCICTPLDLAVTPFQKNFQGINELCNLPNLEITQVTNSNNKNVTESNEWSTSIGVETSREKALKEKSDMENLLKRLPILNQCFQLHYKVGKGTYSSVYLATLKNSNSTKNYAVKHLTHNIEQIKIEVEFRCMFEIGGRDNVVRADCCLTSGDGCVTFIMPYLPHKKFQDYVLDMNADETRLYMKNLFIALRRVHSFNIIHRDVKPENFLYNRDTKQFLLVDFGLAQVVENHSAHRNKTTDAVDENVPIDYSKKRKRRDSVNDKEKTTPVKKSRRTVLKSKDNNVRLPQMSSNFGYMYYPNADGTIPMTNSGRQDNSSPFKPCPSKNMDNTPLKSRALNSVINPSNRRKQLVNESSPDDKTETSRNIAENEISVANSPVQERDAGFPLSGIVWDKTFTPLVPDKSSSGSFVQVQNSRVVRQCEMLKSKTNEVFQKPKLKSPYLGERCSCSGKNAICAFCSSRSKMVAPRAGTPGFRPPEVLFRYNNQTTAVDMWAAGVILLCILSGCYPFFKSPNDLVALAEIMTVFGTDPIIKIAAKFGRRVVCSNQRRGVDIKKLCRKLRARITKRATAEKRGPNDIKCDDCCQIIRKDGCLCISDNPEEEQTSEADPEYGFPDSAFDLLKRLLDLDPTSRITAAQALEHPFILGL